MIFKNRKDKNDTISIEQLIERYVDTYNIVVTYHADGSVDVFIGGRRKDNGTDEEKKDD